jgi:hypothetical protein
MQPAGPQREDDGIRPEAKETNQGASIAAALHVERRDSYVNT